MSQLRLFQTTENVTKKEASAIVHEFLLKVLGEKDEQDIAKAAVLKDLYDCRACVNNIAQAFLKGIILPRINENTANTYIVFGNNDVLTLDDLLQIEERVFDREKRIIPLIKNSIDFQRIDFEDIDFELVSNKEIKVIDVNENDDLWNNQFKNIINIPFEQIRINPFICGEDKLQTIIFICDKGFIAYKAASLAVKYGYINVFYSSYY